MVEQPGFLMSKLIELPRLCGSDVILAWPMKAAGETQNPPQDVSGRQGALRRHMAGLKGGTVSL